MAARAKNRKTFKQHLILGQWPDYAPNFKEVGGAYCFWVVRPSVSPSRFLMHSITLEP